MHVTALLVSALSATVFAAPTFPDINLAAALPGSIDTMTEYFTMLASKVQQSRLMAAAPVCDLSKASLPQLASSPLAPPSPGLTLKHVAIGRGTQNYTCDLSNSTAVPAAAGAVATLFNASCIASTYPDLAKLLARVALQFNLTQSESTQRLAPSNLVVSGKHFFSNLTTPFFDLDVSPDLQLGEAPTAKDSQSPPPPDAATGQQGEPAVAWLKLKTRAGSTGDLQEVYRVETAGGSPPKSCSGMSASFEVQYAAQYWFFEGTPKK